MPHPHEAWTNRQQEAAVYDVDGYCLVCEREGLRAENDRLRALIAAGHTHEWTPARQWVVPPNGHWIDGATCVCQVAVEWPAADQHATGG